MGVTGVLTVGFIGKCVAAGDVGTADVAFPDSTQGRQNPKN